MSKNQELSLVCINALIADHPLYGGSRSQSTRYEGIAASINALDITPDLVMLSEVEVLEDGTHLGNSIAELTGNKAGFWASHTTGRGNIENIGMFGPHVHGAEALDIGAKSAIITSAKDISVAGVHFSYGYSRTSLENRKKQAEAIVGHLEDQDRAIILGDFNSLPIESGRRAIRNHGYKSVFEAIGEKHPRTVPTKEYYQLLRWWQKAIISVSGGLSPDDIYVKGLEVESAGVFSVPSDHFGLWARVRW